MFFVVFRSDFFIWAVKANDFPNEKNQKFRRLKKIWFRLKSTSSWLKPSSFGSQESFSHWKMFGKCLKCHRQNARGKSRENITKMCHQHTTLIFNLSLSPSNNSGLFCAAAFLHARTNKHISFIHYSCSRCCRSPCVSQMSGPLREERKLRNLDVLGI